MKKYYIKPIIILSIMIIIVLGFNFKSKYKINIKTIEGNIKNMDNISLIYKPDLEIFKQEEITINKEGITSKTKVKHGVFRDLGEDGYDGFYELYNNGTVYKTEDYIGFANITVDIENKNDLSRYMIIEEQDRKSKEIKTYKIPLIGDLKDKVSETIFNAKYNENIYSLCYIENLENNMPRSELYILKSNLKNNTCEVVTKLETNISDKEERVMNNFIFQLDNKIYIEMSEFSTKGRSVNFDIYDMESEKLATSNEFMNDKYKDGNLIHKPVLDYNIVENNLNILIKDRAYRPKNDKGNVSKLVYSIKDDVIKLEEIIDYDLNIKYVYNYDRTEPYASYDYGDNSVKDIKLVDDKIYCLYQKIVDINKETKNGRVINLKGNRPIEVLVFDIDKNKNVFKGEIISSDKEIGSKLNFIKNN